MPLFNGLLKNDPNIISLKYLTHSVGLNHWSNKKCTPNQVIKLNNRKRLLLFPGSLNNGH